MSFYDHRLHPNFRDFYIKKVLDKIIEEDEDDEEMEQMKSTAFAGLFSMIKVSKQDLKLAVEN